MHPDKFIGDMLFTVRAALGCNCHTAIWAYILAPICTSGHIIYELGL